MNARPSALIVAASLVLAWPAAAEQSEPAKAQQASQPAEQRAPAVLASADAVKLPTALKAGDAAAPAKKPRAARVTTCRCGDVNQR